LQRFISYCYILRFIFPVCLGDKGS